MEKLDYYALCNIASFLDIENFRCFVSTCRACAGCRNDLRTLAFVVKNTPNNGDFPENFIFARFGSAAIRFFATKCCKDVAQACYFAIWVAVDHDDRALSLLAPLCTRSDVQTVFGQCRVINEPMVMEALRFLDVPPDLYADLRKGAPENLRMSEEVFDAIYRFNRTREFPTQMQDFVEFANRIVSWEDIGLLDRMVSALEETDADGSLKVANIDRVVALLETLPNGGISDLFDRASFIYEVKVDYELNEQESECGWGNILRPFGGIVRRLFAIAPRPLTLKQQVDMLNVCLNACFFNQAEALFAHSKEEAEAVLSNFSCCKEESECTDARIAERLQARIKRAAGI